VPPKPLVSVSVLLFVLVSFLALEASDRRRIEAFPLSASNVQVKVLNARDLIDSAGRLTTQDLNTTDPPFDTLMFSSRPDVVVIFVHGYSNDYSAGKQRAEVVAESIASVQRALFLAAPAAPQPHIGVLSFLWRGDLGEHRFGRAQTAADSSSLVLRETIRSLKRREPQARLVVMTHSLGARVALEAITRGCDGGTNGFRIWGLALLQPAVQAGSLYSWNYSESYRDGERNWVSKAAVRRSGEYDSGLRCVEHLFYTTSRNDDVLDTFFAAKELFVPHYRPESWSKRPMDGGALGSPFTTKAGSFGAYQPQLRDPSQRNWPGRGGLMPDYHLKGELVAFLKWTKPTIDHPDCWSVNLTPGLMWWMTDVTQAFLQRSWHSAMFGSARWVLDDAWLMLLSRGLIPGTDSSRDQKLDRLQNRAYSQCDS